MKWLFIVKMHSDIYARSATGNTFFNVNRVLNPVQRGKILSKLKKETAQVALLQETHLSQTEQDLNMYCPPPLNKAIGEVWQS